MPAQTTRRRKVFTEEELKDIEQKRFRGELSCAECRRLKLRCDKKIPCGSCCRRGCDSICPCGILSAGQGTRFILADTSHLHQKISDMSTRIRQLEDALAILQSSVASDRHPLLDDTLLKIKFGAEARQDQVMVAPYPADAQAIDAFGTLTLSETGAMRYFGRTAGSETLMAGEEWDDDDSPDVDEDLEMTGVIETGNKSANFPFTTDPIPISKLVDGIPTEERTRNLVQSYIDHASLFFRPIKSEELLEEYVPRLYKDPTSLPGESLAMIFFILALGALLDLKLCAYNKEAEFYYHFGSHAISARLILDVPQIDTIRAIGLMATYHSMASKKYSRDSAWCCMALTAKLAQSIGLHRDSARWNMAPTTVQRHRTLWWEVFSSDVSHCLAMGRPPSIHPSFTDCEFPIDEEATLGASGEIEYGFWRMKYTFARDIFMPIIDATLAASPPSYGTILELDKKVRQMSFPSSINPYVRLEDGEADYYSSTKALRDFYASSHRTVTMIYLHRSFFAQSILDYPSNPLLSPFAPSFLIAYRSASILIKATAHHFDRCAELGTRMWFLLYHVFSAAVITGTIVTRSPTSNITPGALLDLNLALQLFERSSSQCDRARIALGVLRKLKDKAARTYAQSLSPSPMSKRQQNQKNNDSSISSDSDDELAIFGGQRRVLTKSSRPKNSISTRAHSPVPSILETSTTKVPTQTAAHLSLIDYLDDGWKRDMASEVPFEPSGDRCATSLAGNHALPSSLLPPHNDANVAPRIDPDIFMWDTVLDLRADLVRDGHGERGTLAPIAPHDEPLATTHQYTSTLLSLPHLPIAPQSISGRPSAPIEQSPSNEVAHQSPTAGSESSLLHGGISNTTVGTDSRWNDAMTELRLMTDSSMDSEWLSFMQECGIFGA